MGSRSRTRGGEEPESVRHVLLCKLCGEVARVTDPETARRIAEYHEA